MPYITFGNTYPQHFILMLIEYMRHKTPVGSKPLPRHHVAHPPFLLRHVPNMIPIRIHNDIFVGLFETTAGTSICQLDTRLTTVGMEQTLTSSHSSSPIAVAPPIPSLPADLLPDEFL